MRNETCAMVLAVMLVACLGAVFWFRGEEANATERQGREIAGLRDFIRKRVEAEEKALVLSPPLAGYRVSSGCGYRMDPMGGGTEGLHKGADFAGEEGEPVMATLAGRVAEHWPPPDGYYDGHPTFGGYITIEHDGVLLRASLYGHLSETFVHEGDWVEAGEPIGLVGSTGVATGPHLHFELVVDPEAALAGMLPRPGYLWAVVPISDL